MQAVHHRLTGRPHIGLGRIESALCHITGPLRGAGPLTPAAH
jgi:hypothetical protein